MHRSCYRKALDLPSCGSATAMAAGYGSMASAWRGLLYVRFALDEKRRWRVFEIYVDGSGQALSTAVLRQLRLDLLEAAILEHGEHLLVRSRTPGPDLRRLAAHFATTWGQQTMHCAVRTATGVEVLLKGGARRPPRPTRGVPMQNWCCPASSLCLSCPDAVIPQLPARIRQVPDAQRAETHCEPAGGRQELPALEPPAWAPHRQTASCVLLALRLRHLLPGSRTPPAPAIAPRRRRNGPGGSQVDRHRSEAWHHDRSGTRGRRRVTDHLFDTRTRTGSASCSSPRSMAAARRVLIDRVCPGMGADGVTVEARLPENFSIPKPRKCRFR